MKANKEYKEAKKYFLRAIDIKPDNSMYRYCYGQFLYRHLRDFENAKIELKRAIDIEPNEPKYYQELAVFLRDAVKDYQDAEKYYLKCLQITKANGDEPRDSVNGSYGFLLYLLKRYKESEHYMKIELKLQQKKKEPYLWSQYYWFLLNMRMNENKVHGRQTLKWVFVLEKVYDLINDETNGNTLKSMLSDIYSLMESDPDDKEYHQKLENAIKTRIDNIYN